MQTHLKLRILTPKSMSRVLKLNPVAFRPQRGCACLVHGLHADDEHEPLARGSSVASGVVPSRRLVASSGADGTVMSLWEAAFAGREGVGPSAGRTQPLEHPPGAPPNEWRRFATLEGQTDTVWGLGMSSEGHVLASGGFDRVVRLCEASSGTCLRIPGASVATSVRTSPA